MCSISNKKKKLLYVHIGSKTMGNNASYIPHVFQCISILNNNLLIYVTVVLYTRECLTVSPIEYLNDAKICKFLFKSEQLSYICMQGKISHFIENALQLSNGISFTCILLF